MGPSFWQIPSEPTPPYEDEEPGPTEEHLQIEGPEEPEGEDTRYLQLPEEEEEVTEARKSDANKILDEIGLPNYDDVEMRLAEPETSATKQRNYLNFILKDAETERKRAVAIKSNATKAFKAGKITKEVRDLYHNRSNLLQLRRN